MILIRKFETNRKKKSQSKLFDLFTPKYIYIILTFQSFDY
jgi:hypothetical protein